MNFTSLSRSRSLLRLLDLKLNMALNLTQRSARWRSPDVQLMRLGDSVCLLWYVSFLPLTTSIAVLFRILELMHEALTSNVVVSKRYLVARFLSFFLRSGGSFLTDGNFNQKHLLQGSLSFQNAGCRRSVCRYSGIYIWCSQGEAQRCERIPCSSHFYPDVHLDNSSFLDCSCERTCSGRLYYHAQRWHDEASALRFSGWRSHIFALRERFWLISSQCLLITFKKFKLSIYLESLGS